jgi:putative addiction module component (TIGR02574 family)
MRLRTSTIGSVNAHALAEILDLPAGERIRVVQTIWESVIRNPDDVPVTEAQRRELDARLAAFELDQDPGEPWEKIKDSLSDE